MSCTERVNVINYKALHLLILIAAILLSGCSKLSGEKDMIDYEQKHFDINESFILNSQNGSFEIIEPLWWSVDIYNGEEKYTSDLSNFTKEQRYIYAINWYLAEVNNGGHEQFYFNSTGIVAEDALEGFKELGLIENYNILKESFVLMGGVPSKDREERQNQLEKLEPNFEELDNRFYDTEFETVMIKYIRDNSSKFYFEGTVEIPN